jgi:hypothetical protein
MKYDFSQKKLVTFDHVFQANNSKLILIVDKSLFTLLEFTNIEEFSHNLVILPSHHLTISKLHDHCVVILSHTVRIYGILGSKLIVLSHLYILASQAFNIALESKLLSVFFIKNITKITISNQITVIINLFFIFFII